MRELTVVVTCTDRKCGVVDPRLRVRSLPQGSVSDRVREWRGRLAAAPGARLLTDLYRGEAWTRVPALLRAAERAGFRPRPLVASAGLGLRGLTDEAPAYGATFSLAQQDRVAADATGARAWWRELRSEEPCSVDLTEARGSVLLVLSAAYAEALDDDIHALARHGADVMLVGGARDVAGLTRLPSDRALRHVLGGTTTSLNVRIATRWLEELPDASTLSPRGAFSRWSAWAGAARRPDVSGRRLSDDEVRAFVREVATSCPPLSASRALRLLRNSGHACEQQRFRELFRQAVSA